ncbi:hypothetical protein J6590_079136 [Homalodisca vitripennis]|nr:hypothetical protein J6590_079136 [Homalodisca vitripennis]
MCVSPVGLVTGDAECDVIISTIDSSQLTSINIFEERNLPTPLVVFRRHAADELMRYLKIIRDHGESQHIFLYEGVVHTGKQQIRVVQMLSEKQDSKTILYWLNEWQRCCAPSKEVVTDDSKALQSAVCRSFSRRKACCNGTIPKNIDGKIEGIKNIDHILVVKDVNPEDEEVVDDVETNKESKEEPPIPSIENWLPAIKLFLAEKCSEKGNRINPYCAPSVAEKFTTIVRDVVLWSGVMGPLFKSPYLTTSSASVERRLHRSRKTQSPCRCKRNCFTKFDDIDKALIQDSLYADLQSKDEQDLHLQRLIELTNDKQHRLIKDDASQRSSGVRSGERAGHSIASRLPIHRCGNLLPYLNTIVWRCSVLLEKSCLEVSAQILGRPDLARSLTLPVSTKRGTVYCGVDLEIGALSGKVALNKCVTSANGLTLSPQSEISDHPTPLKNAAIRYVGSLAFIFIFVLAAAQITRYYVNRFTRIRATWRKYFHPFWFSCLDDSLVSFLFGLCPAALTPIG